ncbi:MAG TPA: GNVR domain-containing protein, partial [Bacteroidales bacterium]|nr:GNVR domain-containing protein [Bacteroidales bacterium]
MNSDTPYTPPNLHEDDSIDIRRYVSLFLSNWYWFAAALFISLSIAYGINRWSEEVYTVTSTLLIKDDANETLTQIFQSSEGFKSQQKVNNEIGILKSFTLNYMVMQKLPEFSIIYTSVGKRGIAESRMYKTSPFIVKYDSLEKQSLGRRINIRILSDRSYKISIEGNQDFERELNFGDRFNEEGFDFIIELRNNSIVFDPNASNKYYFSFANPLSMANRYRTKLNVVPIEVDASMVTLTTSGYVSRQEADYLNMLMEVYLEFGLEYKNQTAAQTLEFIENQLRTISDSLRIAENDLESFRLNNNLIDISHEGQAIQQKFEQTDEEKTMLHMQKNYYGYLKDYVDSKTENSDPIAPSLAGINDHILEKLIDELAEFQRQKRQLSINLKDFSEPLRSIETNIINTRISLKENINYGLQKVERSIADVDYQLQCIESEIRKLPTTERQMIKIQRKFDINNTVYTFLLEKRAEAGIARASNVSDNRIIDKAGSFSSSMIKPKRDKNIATALILGILAPLFAIILLDLFNDKVIDKKDIEKVTSSPIIGYISHNNTKSEIPVFENPSSTLSESFRSVRTSLKYFL